MTVTGAGSGPADSVELSITTQVLGEQVMLAGAHPQGLEWRDRDSMHYTLHTSPILLAAMPESVEIAGILVAEVESYAITMTFSDGAATSRFWRVTVEVPDATAPGAGWRVRVPFSHHLVTGTMDAPA